jgi:hypothetical protein
LQNSQEEGMSCGGLRVANTKTSHLGSGSIYAAEKEKDLREELLRISNRRASYKRLAMR